MTIKQILFGIQTLLDKPNLLSPANGIAADVYSQNIDTYNSQVKDQARAMTPHH